jgi:hypothetical protein
MPGGFKGIRADAKGATLTKQTNVVMRPIVGNTFGVEAR